METKKEKKPRKAAEDSSDVKLMIRLPKLAAAALAHAGKVIDLDARGMLENTVIASLRGADIPLKLAEAVDQMRRVQSAAHVGVSASLFDSATPSA